MSSAQLDASVQEPVRDIYEEVHEHERHRCDQHRSLDEAIVVSSNEVTVVEGPDSQVKRFELIEGARVEVLDRQGQWIRIHDAEGRDGWADADSFEII